LGWILFALATLPVGGCKMSSEQQIAAAQAAVPILQQAVDVIAVKMEAARQGMLAMEEALSDPNLSFGDKAKAQALLAEYRGDLERWIQLAEPTAAALVKVREVVDHGPEGAADVTDVLRMAAQAIAAVAPLAGPQVGAWLKLVAEILAALVLLLTGGGAVAVQKLRTLRTGFNEVVAGGEAFKDAMADPATIDRIKELPAKEIVTLAVKAFKAAQGNEQRAAATGTLVALAKLKRKPAA
jgi:hypothetical protein